MNPLNLIRDPFGFGNRKLNHLRTYVKRADLSGKTFLVTGTSKGIGQALVQKLKQSPVNLVTVARGSGECSAEHTHLSLNLDDPKQVANLCEECPVLDGIVFNAGGMPRKAPKIYEALGVDHLYILHVLGPAWIVRQLIRSHKLRPQSRIVVVSSGGALATPLNNNYMGSLTEPYDAIKQYAFHKRQQIQLIEYFQNKYTDFEYDFYAMHPGWVDTQGLQQGMPIFYSLTRGILRDAYAGADSIEWLLCSERQKSGYLYFDRKVVSSYPLFWVKRSAIAGQEFAVKLEIQLSQLDEILGLQ